ncbi:hypothetical protein IJG98_00440 [Candidatus Saccharibacteria bacterium]|nr:hypothetical protein [Candidatus Saccharibacteria bacterium]
MAKDKKRLHILCGAVIGLSVMSATFFSGSQASAKDTSSFSSHKSACVSGANSIDPTGTAALVCNGYTDASGTYQKGAQNCVYTGDDAKGNPKGNGYTYGAVFLEPASSATELDGTNSLTLKAYGATYNCNTYNTKTNAEEISFSTGISANGTTLTRPSPNPSTWSWGARSSDYLTVTVSPSAVAGATADSSGKFTKSGYVWSKLEGNRGGTASKPINIEFYKIVRIDHDTPSVTYDGATYTDGDTILINGTSANLTFDHFLKRTDGWGGTENITDLYSLNSGSRRGINGLGTTATKVSDTQNNKTATPEGAEYCSTLTHYTVRGLAGYSAKRGSSTSKICVKLKLNALAGKSYSAAGNTIGTAAKVYSDAANNVTSVSSNGGSQQASYTLSFYHGLNIVGDSTKSADFNYTIYTGSSSSGPWTAISGATGTQRLSGSSGDVQVRAASQTITLGYGETGTVCEKITMNPTLIVIGAASGSGSGSSIACASVTRLRPVKKTITATTDVIADNDGDKNPSGTKYSTNEYRNLTFYHSFANDHSGNLNTTYTIEFKQDNGAVVEYNANTAIGTPTSSPVIHQVNNIQLAETAKTTICERVRFNTSTYHLHTNGSLESLGTTGYSDWRCITLARPGRRIIDDGEITVYSESSGALKNTNQTGGYDTTHAAWLMKTQQADITYTHKLWRVAEKHTGDGTHQAAVTSPAEDVTVRYRFADPATTFAATDISTTHTSTIATDTEGSKYSFNSVSASANPTDSLKNANTVATASKVGQLYEYCQSISYVSEKYTLRGIYWQVDGAIYTGDPSLQGTEPPVSKELVGKSVKGCVNVIRPYNFNVNSITAKGDIEPANAGQQIEADFTIHVSKNDSTYMITDVPNNPVKKISFILNDKPTSLAGAANVSSSPCDYFSSKLGSKMDAGSCNDSTTTTLPHHNNAGFYTGNSYTININYPSTIPNLPTNKKYCLAIAFSPTSSNANGSYGFTDTFNTNYTISDATCYNIGKYPTMQVWGGSLYTRGGTNTSKTDVGNTTFGSWDDYLIIAKDKVKNTASGAALISGTNNFSNCNISPLTIANGTVCPNGEGDPGLSNVERVERVMSGIKNRYVTGTGEYATLTETEGSSYLINRNVLNSALSYYPILLYNADDPAGSVKPVYIKQDLDIGFSTRSFKNFVIPQVIIYTPGDIYIDPGVSHIDAWLLAGGKIYTCANASGTNIRLTSESDKCSGRLTVTGPVVAEEVHFDRIYGGDSYDDGSGSTIKEPAEIFDLNPGAYLFGANEATDDAQPITTYIHELPPRY